MISSTVIMETIVTIKLNASKDIITVVIAPEVVRRGNANGIIPNSPGTEPMLLPSPLTLHSPCVSNSKDTTNSNTPPADLRDMH